MATIVAVSFFMSGCIHTPESLNIEEGTVLTNFSEAKSNNPNSIGKHARWGGVIAKVQNKADGTMLEIVHFELRSSLRPAQKDQTQGRFRVHYDGFLDPVVYKEGRSITAVGIIGDKEADKIGEHAYEFPVLKASNIHLWKEIKEIDVRISQRPLWYSPALWYSPRPYYYSPFYQPLTRKNTKNSSQKNKK